MRTRTRELALSGLLGALAVVLLSLGGAVPLATYTAPVLASAALLPVREECRPSYAWCCWAFSAALGLLLSPDKEGALLYAFLGWYPLLKPRLDALRSRPLRVFVKLLVCVVSVGAMYALLLWVLQLEAVAQEFAETAPALLLATAAMGVALLTALYRRRRKK